MSCYLKIKFTLIRDNRKTVDCILPVKRNKKHWSIDGNTVLGMSYRILPI